MAFSTPNGAAPICCQNRAWGKSRLFPLCYALLCILAYFLAPRDETARRRTGLWVCLAAFGLLFLLVEWHPQWLILLAPFVVLTTLLEQQRFAWCCVDIALCSGFFSVSGLCPSPPAGGKPAGFWRGGAVDRPAHHRHRGGKTHTILLQFGSGAGRATLCAVQCRVVCHIALKIPLAKGTPASRLAAGGNALYQDKPARPAVAYFGLPAAAWLLPTLLPG